MSSAVTAFDKMWALHAILQLPDGRTLLHVDRHLTHELTSPRAFATIARKGRRVRRPELTVAVEDHILATDPGRDMNTYKHGAQFVLAQREHAARFAIPLVDVHHPDQGIVHVIAAELALALPGTTVACGDSHTCTLGGLGALAFGIGTSDVEHVLSTQTLPLAKPRNMRIRFDGNLPLGVSAKDLMLHVLRTVGVRGGVGYAVEFAGPAIATMSIEGRQTLCNMAVEMGARFGFVAADRATFDYLRGRAGAPRNAEWDVAVKHWASLASDANATFEREVAVDCATLAPYVTWGTTPEHAIAVTERVPDPNAMADPPARETARRALAYMGLTPGEPLAGHSVQVVFIGSCNGSRLSDLKAAAKVIGERRVAKGVRAMVVPGSTRVRREAEASGLDRVFREAGFEWRESACSMCAAVNADIVPPGARCVATTNRNFEGRQGRGARTHLASAAMAAAAAVTGQIVDVRLLAH